VTAQGVPELVGRQLLHDHLSTAAASARAGRGRLLLLTGEPGIGKTSLAADLARACADDGFLVLWGTGWDGEGTPSFWPWLEAIRGCLGALPEPEVAAAVVASGPELARLLPELVRPAAEPAVPAPAFAEGGRDGAQFRLFDAVWSFVRTLAGRRPLLIVLDDLQWADPATLDLLRFVAPRTRSTAVLVAGAYRDVEIGPDHPLRAALAALRAMADVVGITGLDRAAVAELLAAVEGHSVPPEVVEKAHDRTGGNPFFVREMARLMEVQGDRVGIPAAVRDVVERRLARLSQPCHALLRIAAVVGQEADVSLLAEVAGTSESAVVDLVREAEWGRIVVPTAHGVSGIRFVHDLFRETLHDATPAATAAELHRRVGIVLEQRVDRGAEVGAAELAHHFLRAGPDPPVRARAVRYSLDAARDALTRLAPQQALAHARRALGGLDSLTEPDEQLRLEVLLVMADAERRTGQGAECRGSIERAAGLARRLGSGAGLARAALLAQLLGEDYGTGAESTWALLQEAATALDDQQAEFRARVLAALARHLYHHDRPRAGDARALATAAVEAAESSGDDSALAFALFALHDTLWQPGTASQRLEVARRMESVAAAADPELRAESVLLGAVARLELCDPAATEELQRYSRLAAAQRDPRHQYWALTRRITVATMEGELASAEKLTEEASLLAEAAGEPDGWHVEMRELWLLRTFQGRRHELEERVRSWSYPLLQAWYAAQVVLAICDRGAAEEARVAASRLAGFDPAGEPLHNLWLVQAATVAEAAAAVGDRDLAARLYDALVPYAGLGVVTAGAVDFYGAVDQYLGLLAATLGRRNAAAEHVRRAIELHRRLGASAWVARSQRVLAEVADVPNAEAPAAASRGLFRHDGEWWTVEFDGRMARLPDAKGLHDIRTLLGTAGRSVPAADLLAATAGDAAAEEAGLGADEVLDPRARAAYRARLAELDEDLAEAEAHNDLERISRARFERQLLAEELAAAVGLGGRARLLGSGSERARKAVTARIRNSLRRMARSHPQLAAHLSASITTGSSCSYVPDEAVTWEL
jgi:hypothetical protein